MAPPTPIFSAPAVAQQGQQQQQQQQQLLLDLTSRLVSPSAPFAQVANASVPDTSTLAAADFDIDVRSGFMPPEPPVERLSGSQIEMQWEDMLDRARTLPLRCGDGGLNESEESRRAAWQWRRDIRKMPVHPLSSNLASDIRHARRGHLVLAFIAHFYIHSQPPAITADKLSAELFQPELQAAALNNTPGWLNRLASWRDEMGGSNQKVTQLQPILGLTDPDDQEDYKAERLGRFASTIPAALAVPWCALSDKLDLPPILTYATTVLWNWGLVDKHKPASAPGNLRILTTFTGNRSEEWFYATSALIELRGVEALTLMRRSLDEAFLADALALRRLTLFLHRLAGVIGDLERLLADVRRECEPEMFYFAIRPWFRAADDPAGWHYEGVDAPGVRRALTGPSAGQSSLIHALDQFLAIEHSPEASAGPAGSSSSGAAAARNATFMQKMSLYMPGHHRRFLEHLRRMNVEDSMLESQRELARAKAEAEAELLQQRREPSSDGDHGREGQKRTESDADSAKKESVEPVLTRPDPLAASSTLHPIRRLALTPTSTVTAQPPNTENPAPEKRTTTTTVFEPTPLSRAYDAALYALKSLRDEHMRIATLYIISQARRGAPPEGVRSWLPGSFTGVVAPTPISSGGGGGKVKKGVVGFEEERRPVVAAVAVAEDGEVDPSSAAKGTGGTPLVSFLKECRANTIRAMLEPGTAAAAGTAPSIASASNAGVPKASSSPVARKSKAGRA